MERYLVMHIMKGFIKLPQVQISRYECKLFPGFVVAISFNRFEKHMLLSLPLKIATIDKTNKTVLNFFK